jgi:hypothetical protein
VKIRLLGIIINGSANSRELEAVLIVNSCGADLEVIDFRIQVSPKLNRLSEGRS